MKNLLFVDLETTGTNPQIHQAYEFACVPILDGVIHRSKLWHTWIRHPSYTFSHENLIKFGERITKKPDNVQEIAVKDFGPRFLAYLEKVFPIKGRGYFKKVTLGGKNVAGFDLKFMCRMAPRLETWDEVSYSCVDLASLYDLDDDEMLPSLMTCKLRAKMAGANLKYDNNHTADSDALLSAELYCWAKWRKIWWDDEEKAVA